MKKVLTSNITSTKAAKIKKGTLDHLQDAHIETARQLAINAIGDSYNSSNVYVLYGCKNTGTGLNYIISAGAVFASNEIYLVPAATFTAGAGQIAVLSLTNTYRTGTEFDPVTFTDGSTHNIHADFTGVFAAALAPASPYDIDNLIYINSIASLTLVNTWDHGTGTYGLQTAKVILNQNKVEFSGNFVTGLSSLKNQTITTIDAEFRPSADRYFFAYLDTLGGAGQYLIMKVASTGEVSVQTVIGGGALTISGTVIHLNGLGFYK